MKLIETALFSQSPDLLTTLISPLSLDNENVLDIDVFRLEIDEDLAILMYDLKNGVRYPVELMTHLQQHLGCLLIITEQDESGQLVRQSDMVEQLLENLSHKPAVVAVKLNAASYEELNQNIRQHGFFLSERGRILFWSEDNPASIAKIWKTLWHQMPALA